MTAPPKTARNSLPDLWEQAVSLWNNLVLGFGHPVDLMRWGWMRALEHRALGHWLRDLEALVRRAIRADAETCELPPLRPRAKRRAPRPIRSNDDMPRFRRSYGDDPTTWKVSFRMSKPGPRPAATRRSRAGYQPAERRRCRNLAYRIEALRRAISYREAYVLRHARRLARIREANVRDLTEALKAFDPPQPTTAAASPEPQPRSAKLVEPG